MNLISTLKREVSRQFYRFALVGAECAVLNYLVFLILLYHLSVNYLISAGAGAISGIAFGFAFNKVYSFKSKREAKIEVIPYFLVYLTSFAFMLLALRILVDNLGLTPIIANALILPVTTLINFFGQKIFVFKNKRW
jgi:putative flippase GtrA